jgi:hypothetical protein
MQNFEKVQHSKDKHHKMPRSHNGGLHPRNIEVMDTVKHRALHILYKNAQPIEQIEQSVKLNESTFDADFLIEMQTLIEFWKKQGRDAYHPDIFTNKK